METHDEWKPQAVVLCAGDYPTHALPLHLLRDARHVVCCDGATAEYMQREGRQPWYAVGDGDSLPLPLREQLGPRFIHITEQETNDQTKATRLLYEKGIRRVAYVGATGRREDHTLGNISHLADYQQMGMDVRMYTDYGVFMTPCPFPDGSLQLRCTVCPGSQLSVFALGNGPIEAEGVKYPLPERLTAWWQGTLNEAVVPHLSFKARIPFLVYLAY